MRVLIIDYGMGNLGSVSRALEQFGVNPCISDNPADLETADRIILPGVGAFPDGMRHLTEAGWLKPLRETVLNENIPLLGICLGMQLLADRGFEGTEIEGLGLLPGEVRRLEPTVPSERVPHVGWNDVIQWHAGQELLADIPDRTDFYFVHSYHFIPANPEHVAAMTPYCGMIVSAVANGPVFGTQFHPEKSSKYGLRLLENFLKIRVPDYAHDAVVC